MKHSIIQAAEQYVTNLLQTGLSKNFSYHDLNHTLMVTKAARLIGGEMNLSSEEKEVLELAALFHDTGFTQTYTGHETISKKIARTFLVKENYPAEKIDQVESCITATQVDFVPETILQKILKDADFNNLNGQSYKKKSIALRQEWEVFLNEKVSDEEWMQANFDFWKEHQFFTKEGEVLFGAAKAKHFKRIVKQKKEGKGRKKEKKKRVVQENNGILATKSSQMMFKTTLRNHIDLTAIADNKANIMLSINALIITVTMPLLVSNIEGNKYLLIPTSILLVTCILSIIFATLATRPVPTQGITDIEKIGKGITNLFFYGNFWKMPLSDYKSGIEKVATNDAILDDTVVNDLYFLGKALGRKFFQLRICYSIFMVGMTLTVVAFVASFVWNM